MTQVHTVHLCTLPTLEPLPAFTETTVRVQYTPDAASAIAALSIDGLNLFALPSGERISRQHKEWAVESTRLREVWQHLSDDTRLLVDGSSLVIESGGVVYPLTESPVVGSVRTIKPVQRMMNPAPLPSDCDPLPLLLSILRRSAVAFGRPQVYVEPDGRLTLWTSTTSAVSVQVSAAETRLTLHQYDPVSLQQHPAASERVYAPLSGAAVLRLFASAVFS